MDNRFKRLADQLEDAEKAKIPMDIEEIIQEAAVIFVQGGVKSVIDIRDFTDTQLRLLGMGLAMINDECVFCKHLNDNPNLLYGDSIIKIVEDEKDNRCLIGILSYHDPAPVSYVYDYMLSALDIFCTSQWGEDARWFINEATSTRDGHFVIYAWSMEHGENEKSIGD